jgi:hypothetical protein
MDIEEMLQRKEWSSAIYLWVFRKTEKGSKAHTAFHNHLKFGHDLYLNTVERCCFDSFHSFKRALVRYFFTKLKDHIAVVENNLKRINLTSAGADGAMTPTTLERFRNNLCFHLKPSPRGGFLF